MDYILEKYIKKFRFGDEAAFDQIYNLTYRKIFFIVLPILQDKSLSEDIMQDTYLKFLEKINEYKPKNSLAYILTIARNLAINEYNNRKKVISLKNDDISQFGFDEYLEIKEAKREMINNVLKVLTPIEKNIFLLHTLENLKHREIAIILNKPIGTITWLYQQSLKKMKKKLKG